ncbi:MAG TPA: energy transducer TonB [Gemmatimonadales bacterium]|nr:energy transducer TonB [Gemmatimonadales bacterium]
MTRVALLLAFAVQQPDTGVILADSLDAPPTIVRDARLNYPLDLLRGGRQGRVIVQFVLDTTGQAEPGSLRVIASAHRGFNLSAKAYVRDLVFTPPTFHGRKVRALMQLPVEFRIGGGP